MIKLSAAVMAHPKRAPWAGKLADRLGLGGDRIVWDRCNDIWDTARRAWLAFDPEASHHLVIQDDALACLDLIAGAEQALTHVPDDAAVSLYLGTRRPMVREVSAAVEQARASGASWVVLNSLCWGVAVIMPTYMITRMIAFGDEQKVNADDVRIRRFVQTQLHWQVWHPWPSLVDHRDEGSLVGHRATGRRAHQFIGADVSALGVDWSGSVVQPARGPASRILRVTTGG